MAALALIALLGGLATSLWQAREARIQRDLANAEAAKAKQRWASWRVCSKAPIRATASARR